MLLLYIPDDMIRKISDQMTLPELESFMISCKYIYNLCTNILHDKKILIQPLIYKYRFKQHILNRFQSIEGDKIMVIYDPNMDTEGTKNSIGPSKEFRLDELQICIPNYPKMYTNKDKFDQVIDILNTNDPKEIVQNVL